MLASWFSNGLLLCAPSLSPLFIDDIFVVHALLKCFSGYMLVTKTIKTGRTDPMHAVKIDKIIKFIKLSVEQDYGLGGLYATA